MDAYRVRTSYEKVVAHRSGPPFAYSATQDGVIDNIDDNAHVLTVKYKSGDTVAVNYGDDYTNNGGGGFYCTQNIVINNLNKGDKVKRGDIIVYNEKFFTPDPYSKQVEWNCGVEAHVACLDNSTTLDDGNAISQSLADKLAFNPVHVRDIVLKKNTTIHKYAHIGDMVQNIDPLLIFDQSQMSDDMFGKLQGEAVDLLAKLNRQTPKAKFTGKIVKIDAFHKCPLSQMSPGLRSIVAKINKDRSDKQKAAQKAVNIKQFGGSTQITYSNRIGMTDLDDETVVLRFYIQQDYPMDCGSKIQFESAFKSVTSNISPTDWQVEDKSITVQALFSSVGICNRICVSPLTNGTAARVMQKTEKDILQMYFD